MTQTVRFFHIRRYSEATHGGATAKVVGDFTKDLSVEVQVTHCSKKDSFCKRIGREEAAKQPVKVVPLRYLPQELARIAAKVDSQPRDFTFAIKYFLPRE